ncbi:nucleotide sugar dehydrogenase [Actomonas aquatica]|uniref:UDP-glucose 6-dehydrogenase n=1 Tax=Actomonas aquatica TaxID=2866162 RepID=A0ABZ1CAS1_9BACT|nr:nucleotide sugar dehydrogenase [Opitutus sp. WL0086]WRQ88487.1 nucleotide sugar dehydrogenase [Opitutus sp. WL0086]
MTENVSIIGLGKLGASMVAGMASRGLNVIGVDINRNAVDAVNAGRAPVQETGLDEMIGQHRERIRATLDTTEAVLQSDISFVIVPTPSDERGAFTLQYASYAFKALGQALKKKDGYHVIVLTSTVLPGATRHGLLPILEKESGKVCGRDFGLCYNPEFIALGSVIRDFLNPDFYLLGQFDERSGDLLESVHNKVSENAAPVKRMTIENAELAKIAVNSYVTMKISFANMLSEFCENIPGGDVDVVSDALGMDKRIGRKYLTGGFGFGGPCFPRDNVALNFMGNSLDVDSRLLAENDDYNRNLAKRYVARLQRDLPKGANVAVLGLAYKAHSHVIEESPGILLCKALSEAGYRVIGHDNLAAPYAETALKMSSLVTDSLEEALKDAQVVLITTNDPDYLALTADQVARDQDSVTIVDFWRTLGHLAEDSRVRYLPMGRCLDDAGAAEKLEPLWTS